jgi:hypothetical protein
MLLGRPLLKNAIVAHDCRNNTMTIQGNGMVGTIVVNKHLGMKGPKLLLCCNYQNGITHEKEDSYLLHNDKCFP